MLAGMELWLPLSIETLVPDVGNLNPGARVLRDDVQMSLVECHRRVPVVSS